ncbi:MAG: ABC transporter permease [Pseudolabrys sp.]|nr:ABC transporter permease [Pseudolabrys sp.]
MSADSLLTPAKAAQTPVRVRAAGPQLSVRLRQLLAFVVVFGVWEAVVRFGLVDPFVLPAPLSIGERLLELTISGEIFVHAYATTLEMMGGFILGAVLGVMAGMGLALAPRIAETVDPFIVMLNGLPRAALAPLFVVWLGIGLSSKIAIGASIVFFICLFATHMGMRTTDAMLLRAVEALGATPRQLLIKVRLPSTVPWILTALKSSVGMSLIGAVIGELVAASRGLGWYISYSAGNFDTKGIFAGLFALGFMAIAVDTLVAKLGNRLTRWRPDIIL